MTDLYHFRRRENISLVRTQAWDDLLRSHITDPKRVNLVFAGKPIYFTFEPHSQLRGALWSVGYEEYWWYKYRFMRAYKRERDTNYDLACFDVTHHVSCCINNELAMQIIDGKVNLVLDHELDPKWESVFAGYGYKVLRT